MTAGLLAVWLTALVVGVGIYEMMKENQPEQQPIRVEEETLWENEE